jgi:putative heme-binding domain-containing protein
MFNKGVEPPAGHVIRTDQDGERWDMIAGGFRNPYGLAFNPDGELFVYDADMEWDEGSPWYRPTRVNHVVSGGDYGWRQGTDKWPAYFPDSLPGNADIGLGSPTAMSFGTDSNFPEPYRRALFILDWAYGKIIAVHLMPEGASYRGQAEEFVTGRPLNVTGVDFGPDGSMYFVTGGRRTQSGLYRVRYVGSELQPSLGQAAAGEAKRARKLRRRLEQFHSRRSIEGVGLAWEHLGNDDPWIRHAARVALENQALEQWKLPALTESNTKKALSALMALARSSDPKVQSQIFGRLNDLPWEGLPVQWQLVALRTYQLAFTRMGGGRPGDRNPIIKKIVTASEKSAEVRMEVSRLLIYLKAPGIIPGLLNYVVDAASPEERLFYLFHMRHIGDGWTPAHRRAYFAWLKKMIELRGESHYKTYLKHIAADALAKVPPGEREPFAALFEPEAKPLAPEAERLAKRKVVHQWAMTDFAVPGADLAKRDLANGRRVLKTAACLACHRFGGEGLFVGPDLTAIGARFDARAMLESILEPSRVIDEKYRNMAITTKQGELILGRLVAERDKSLLLAPNPYQPTLTREIQQSAIATRNDSTFSPMPVGLLNSFSREDILDLLAVLKKGEPPVRGE